MKELRRGLTRIPWKIRWIPLVGHQSSFGQPLTICQLLRGIACALACREGLGERGGQCTAKRQVVNPAQSDVAGPLTKRVIVKDGSYEHERHNIDFISRAECEHTLRKRSISRIPQTGHLGMTTKGDGGDGRSRTYGRSSKSGDSDRPSSSDNVHDHCSGLGICMWYMQ